MLQEARASDPRLAGRPAPRVERFTYAVDGADDRTATFYGAAFTAADATPRPGVVLFHTAAGPRDLQEPQRVGRRAHQHRRAVLLQGGESLL